MQLFRNGASPLNSGRIFGEQSLNKAQYSTFNRVKVVYFSVEYVYFMFLEIYADVSYLRIIAIKNAIEL